jgi:hypothetical protein
MSSCLSVYWSVCLCHPVVYSHLSVTVPPSYLSYQLQFWFCLPSCLNSIVFVCLSVFNPVRLSVNLSIFLSVCHLLSFLFVCRCVCLYVV